VATTLRLGYAGELKSPEDYATAAKWILYANATYWSTVEKTRTGPPDQLDALNALLDDRPFLLGEEFTGGFKGGFKGS
jgi:glutathione S-transferase